MTDKKLVIQRAFSLLLLLGGIFLYIVVSLRPPIVAYYAEGTTVDFFGADCWRVVENVNDTKIKHYRDRVHPLFSL